MAAILFAKAVLLGSGFLTGLLGVLLWSIAREPDPDTGSGGGSAVAYTIAAVFLALAILQLVALMALPA